MAEAEVIQSQEEIELENAPDVASEVDDEYADVDVVQEEVHSRKRKLDEEQELILEKLLEKVGPYTKTLIKKQFALVRRECLCKKTYSLEKKLLEYFEELRAKCNDIEKLLLDDDEEVENKE